MMLGVYDYTVVLTYVSVLISMGGMLFSMNGYPRMAIVCLALSGFCDMFDGKIARTKKNRTEVEKKFGIQIDSLADIICFGVGPTLIAYRMGMNHGIGVTILMFYVLAGHGIMCLKKSVRKRPRKTGNVIKDFRLLLWQLHFLFYMCSVRYLAKILSLPCMRLY